MIFEGPLFRMSRRRLREGETIRVLAIAINYADPAGFPSDIQTLPFRPQKDMKMESHFYGPPACLPRPVRVREPLEYAVQSDYPRFDMGKYDYYVCCSSSLCCLSNNMCNNSILLCDVAFISMLLTKALHICTFNRFPFEHGNECGT